MALLLERPFRITMLSCQSHSVVTLQLVEVLWQRGGPAVRRHPAHALQGLVLHRGGVGHRAVDNGARIIINFGQCEDLLYTEVQIKVCMSC